MSCWNVATINLIMEFQEIYPRLKGSRRISLQMMAILGQYFMTELTTRRKSSFEEKKIWLYVDKSG